MNHVFAVVSGMSLCRSAAAFTPRPVCRSDVSRVQYQSSGLNPPPGGALPASVLDLARVTEYRANAHSVWDVKYHPIWVTKYRYKVLRGEVATRTRDLLLQIFQGRDVAILQGSVWPDHVHMLVSVPPQLAPAKLVQYLKCRSSRLLQDEFPQLRKRY